jgi:two-component system alkaline phosphatase synthesis response regulator PhoP
MRILLVEDEEQIRKLMRLNLEAEGYEVVTADDGKTAISIIDNQYFDLIILDVMLPNVDGFQICEKVRLKNDKVAILIVSAKDTSQDRITGLKLGADDYLVKPFNLEEFLLRVHNLLKRSNEIAREDLIEYNFGLNKINFSTYEAKTRDNNITLTNKELMLLKMLIERKNEVVSRQQILQNVWGYDIYPSTRTIDNFILSFRKYFELDPKNPQYFHSVRGVGYKFCDS